MGTQFSVEERARRSAFIKSKWADPEWKARVRAKISISAKAAGVGRWSKGRKRPEHLKEKMSRAYKGSGNPRWKGESAKYNAIIGWIVRNVGRADSYACETCGATKDQRRIFWTSTVRPAERDASKWRALCGSCNRVFRAKQFGEKFGAASDTFKRNHPPKPKPPCRARCIKAKEEKTPIQPKPRTPSAKSAEAASERMKARWADPVLREKMLEQIRSDGAKRRGIKRPHPPGWSEKMKAAWERRKANGTAKLPKHDRPHTPESRAKLSASLKGKMRGEKSPHWRGGITPICQLVRACSDYASWRTGVFQRDGYRCVVCGAKGDIQADHYPRAFADIIRNNLVTSLEDAAKCAELWDVSNGRTLCKDCHRKTDTWAWKGKSKKK